MKTAPNLPRAHAGFTLVESLQVALLLSLLLLVVVTSLAFASRSERRNSVQGDLDLDARLLTERMRRDLWLTSRDRVLLYPPGPGPYTAIGFPVLYRTDDSSMPELPEEGGQVEWNATVIYHLWDGQPREVRRTVFRPNTGLTDAQRLEQVESVVLNGHGQGTYNGANASTRTLVRNLVEWRINAVGSSFDGYSETEGRRWVSFGSLPLSPGEHDFVFRVTGRNRNSQGFRAGMDTLFMSPCAAPREAEAQLPPQSWSGAAPVAEVLSDGTWSGHGRLVFPATGPGHEFLLRMENDRWEERNFRNTGALFEDTVATFDAARGAYAYGIQLTGCGRVWEAYRQTRDATEANPSASLGDVAIRVLLRGENLPDGGWVDFNGTNVWAGFRTQDQRYLRIRDAFIAEADPAAPMNFIPGTLLPLRFRDMAQTIFTGAYESDSAPLHIRKDKSYVVGFSVRGFDPTGMGFAREWTPPDANAVPSSYLVASADSTTVQAPVWNSRSDVQVSPKVFALEYVRAGYAPVGFYTSQVFDTRTDDPQFLEFDWNALIPQGAGLEMRIRAGQTPDLADALPWERISPVARGAAPVAQGRYVQVRARMTPTPDGQQTPLLRDFKLRWLGPTRAVDVGGVFTTGPDHGIIELLVDGARLVQGITVDLTVYKDVSMGSGPRQRLTSSVFAEMSPRNTGL